MDECESLGSDTPELQESSYEALEALSQDDEDEVEELQNSLREVVQDQSVKPKLQCLMVDPSFSMVTVQSEDSGIVWETASSRCSTPWASETSSVSEGCGMEGSGAGGKITIIFDEEKVVRRRTRSGRSSRLSDRFSRPGSSRSASALGVERPEMMEVSQPNVKQEKTETEPDLEEIKNKDQQLFSLISEGYEILNIRVPSKLPTVDEEESTDLQDNLSYLDQTPKIKSRNPHQWTQAQSPELSDVEAPTEDSKQALSDPSTDSDLKLAQTEGPGDIDYFEKFTLVDVVVPEEQAAEQHDETQKPLKQEEPEQTAAKEPAEEISLSVSEESFVFVTDVDIVGEHLDEVFYGEGAPADSLQRSEDGARMRRQSSIKESGSVLFSSEETVLTPIYISPGPPKIIDPILLEEPTAMSFMYSDLYEDAVGERRRSDEEYSEAESVTSEKSFKRFSDGEEADSGYLEKFILKDETPTVDVQSETPDDREEGRMMWPQNKFEMTGCLKRVVQEEDVEETKKEVESKEIGTTQTDVDSQSALPEDEKEYVKEEQQEVQPCEETGVEEKSNETEETEIKPETQKDQSEILESITDKVEHEVEKAEKDKQEIVSEQSDTEREQPSERVESADQVIEEITDKPAANSEIPESISKTLAEEEVSEISESKVQLLTEHTEPETHGESQSEAPLEVSADCEPPVHVNVEVVEKITDEAEIQTQVRIDLQEETSEQHVLGEEQVTAANESKTTSADVTLKDKTGDLGQATEVLIQTDAERDSVEKQTEIIEPHQEVTSADLGKVNLTIEDTLEAAPEIMAAVVKEMVSVGDELILLVPKGQAVEMDIEISPLPEKNHTVEDQVDNQFELITVDENTTAHIETVSKPDAEIQPLAEEEAEVVVKEEAQDTAGLTTAPVEESYEVEQKMDLKEQEVVSSVPSCTLQLDLPVTVLEPHSEIQAKPKIEENAEVAINDVVQDKAVSTLAPVEESHKVERKMDLEEDDVVSSVPSCTPQQDLPVTVLEPDSDIQTKSQSEEKVEVVQDTVGLISVPVEESQKVEQKVDLKEIQTKSQSEEKAEVVQDTVELISVPVEESQKVEQKVDLKEIQTESQSEEKAEVVQDTVELISVPVEESQKVEQKVDLKEIQTESQSEENTEVVHDTIELISVPVESQKVEQKMELEEDEMVSSVPSCTPQQDLPVSVLETDSEIQAKPQIEESVEAVVKNDVHDKVALTLAPVEESHKVEEKVHLEEDEVVSVPSCTPQQDSSSSPGEADVEVVDYEIITKQEVKESLESEIQQQEEPQPESAQEIEAINKELKEESIEYKTETERTVAEEEVGVEIPVLEGEDKGVLSTLKRFIPLEDLSGLHEGDVHLAAADLESYALEEAPEIDIKDDQDAYLHEEVAQQEKDEVVSPEVIPEELEYELISTQDTAEMPEVETEDKKVQSESIKEAEEMTKDLDQYIEDKALEPTTDTELLEADYETIDAEEERQARLAAELQGLDWYCLTCGCLLSEEESSTAEHQNHEVSAVDRAYEEIMEKLSDWISELQGRSENIEDLVSELELAYNSVEDQFHESEAAMQAQNEEMMALVMEQYNSMSVNMEEEKKAKLEQLYDQIVSFQESIDSTKSTLETTAREEETDARSPEDIHARLKVALDSAMSLELGPRGLLVFEDYAKANTSSSHLAQRKGIPVPQRPSLQPQEPGSATSTSVTVYWKVNPGDVIDCFQVYCMEDPQGAISEEYRVTVKESYCVLEELEPDKTYKVWVMAVNYTGCSLPSERLIFRTAPSVPVIDTEGCTVVWDSAILRWRSVNQTPGQSYSLEYCRQYELEGEGLRSISGIKNFEQKVLLQPNENYLFYIKAVNEAGSSEQSEAALISTKGTRFHLLKASAHPALELSVDQTTLHYSQDSHENTTVTDKACPSIFGELLPLRGHYYWETNVSRSAAYRVGVAYSCANRDTPLGENGMSWCLQCIPTPTGCSYQLVHNDVHSSLFIIDIPERVGIFLDYQFSRLSFYNAQSGQLLGSFSQRFTQQCHPAVGMDAAGSVEVCMVQEVPDFTKDS